MKQRLCISLLILGSIIRLVPVYGANNEPQLKVWLLGKKPTTLEEAHKQRDRCVIITAGATVCATIPLVYTYLRPEHALSPCTQKTMRKAAGGLAWPALKLGYAQWCLADFQRQEEEKARQQQEANRRAALCSFDY